MPKMIKFKSLQVALLPSVATQSMSPFATNASFRSVHKNLLCLIIGLIIGVRFTHIWLKDKSQCSNELATLSTLTLNKNILHSTANNSIVNSLSNSTVASVKADFPKDPVEYLFNTTRVLCWIMTNPDNHLTKAIHIRNTWGRRCNKLLFISSQEDELLQTIALPVKEGREHLWSKTKQALKYIYDNHLHEADWFLKADDDTYVIMENLRLFLYPYPADAPLYFGCKFDKFAKQGYMSGGAGYVLSKTALIKFSTEAYDNDLVCDHAHMSEDVQLGVCLEKIGVMAGDSRNDKGMERFVPLPPEYVIPEFTAWWYPVYVHHSSDKNVSCCSPDAISFHYITPEKFYVMEYLLYTLRPFGVFANADAILPTKRNIDDIFSTSEGLQYLHPLLEPPTSSNTNI